MLITVFIHTVPLTEVLFVGWIGAALIMLLAVTLQKDRSVKKILRAVLLAMFLPLIVAVVLLALPFALFTKKKKNALQAGRDFAGRPGKAIENYLRETRHKNR